MATERSKLTNSKLKKEVLPPHRPNNGIGVMLVAATAMFFAVASSAFILRARMAQQGCPAMQHRNTTITIQAPRPAPLAMPTPLAPPVAGGIINVPYPAPQVAPSVAIAPAKCDRKDSVSCLPNAAPPVH